MHGTFRQIMKPHVGLPSFGDTVAARRTRA